MCILAKKVGTGHEVACHDTVPFVLWASSRNLLNIEDAMWKTLHGGGDKGIISFLTSHETKEKS